MSCDFGSLCGFSVHFYTVSPCIGQVTHAFLTRPPLSPQSPHRSALTPSSARLACVKRAASVHPEPGSNSLLKVCIRSDFSLSYCFLGSQISLRVSLQTFNFRCSVLCLPFLLLQMLHCLVFKVPLVALALASAEAILSQLLVFVNTFFNLFQKSCLHLAHTKVLTNGEGGI